MSEEERKEMSLSQEEDDLSWLFKSPEERQPRVWPYVYICAPQEHLCTGDEDKYYEVRAFTDLTRAVCARAVQAGFIPLVPQMYLNVFAPHAVRKYADVRESLVHQWMEMAKEVWVISERITETMKEELAVAESLGKTVNHEKAMIHF